MVLSATLPAARATEPLMHAWEQRCFRMERPKPPQDLRFKTVRLPCSYPVLKWVYRKAATHGMPDPSCKMIRNRP